MTGLMPSPSGWQESTSLSRGEERARTNLWTLYRPPKILKFNTISSGIELPLTMEINLVENLRQYSKVDDFNSDWCKKSLIKDMINHFKKTCSIACIPVQFSALVKGYKISLCIIILIMTVNHKLFLKLLHTQFMFHYF